MEQSRRGFFATIAALFAAKAEALPEVEPARYASMMDIPYYNVSSNCASFLSIPRSYRPGERPVLMTNIEVPKYQRIDYVDLSIGAVRTEFPCL